MTGHIVVTTRAARPAERDLIAQLVADAFTPIPPTVWLMPDPAARQARFVDYMRIWVDHGLTAGVIDVAETPDGVPLGAAIWWREPGPEPADYRTRLTGAIGAEHRARLEVFDAAMQTAHPTVEHLYLGFAAVHRRHQRRGIGAALLRRRHTDLDAASMPAYLVAASPQARRLYLRHGYRDHGPSITLPDGPDMHPMWRHPNGGPKQRATTTPTR